MMIKNYNQFINEDNIPGPSVQGSEKISLNKEDLELFKSNPVLQKLCIDKKVSILKDEVWYDLNDTSTKEILDQYI